MRNIPMVTVEFKALPNFRCLLTEWQEMGGYRGFLKDYSICPKWIKKVHKELLKAEDYPTQTWEG